MKVVLTPSQLQLRYTDTSLPCLSSRNFRRGLFDHIYEGRARQYAIWIWGEGM